MAGSNPGGNAWADINAFVAGPGAGLKSPAQAAAIHGRAEIEQQQIKAGAKVQAVQIQQAGQNQRAAARLSQAQAYRQQQLQLRQQSQQRIEANQARLAADRERQRSIQRTKAVSKAGKTVLDANPIINLHDRIAGLPTPGGLGTLFFVLLTLVFVIVAVNQGQTRLSLFWLTLLGRTTLDTTASGDSGTPTSSATNATGGSVPTQATLAQTAQPGAGSTVPASANLNGNGLPNVKLPGR